MYDEKDQKQGYPACFSWRIGLRDDRGEYRIKLFLRPG